MFEKKLAEAIVHSIRRKTHKKYSAEEKIRIVHPKGSDLKMLGDCASNPAI